MYVYTYMYIYDFYASIYRENNYDPLKIIHLSFELFFNRKSNLSVIRIYKLRSDTPCTYTYVSTYTSFTRSRNAFYAARTLVTFCQRSYETINLSGHEGRL